MLTLQQEICTYITSCNTCMEKFIQVCTLAPSDAFMDMPGKAVRTINIQMISVIHIDNFKVNNTVL